MVKAIVQFSYIQSLAGKVLNQIFPSRKGFFMGRWRGSLGKYRDQTCGSATVKRETSLSRTNRPVLVGFFMPGGGLRTASPVGVAKPQSRHRCNCVKDAIGYRFGGEHARNRTAARCESLPGRLLRVFRLSRVSWQSGVVRTLRTTAQPARKMAAALLTIMGRVKETISSLKTGGKTGELLGRVNQPAHLNLTAQAIYFVWFVGVV